MSDYVSSISRETIKSIFDSLGEVTSQIQQMPYEQAVGVIHTLQDIEYAIGEHLPGGYYQSCEYCELPFGIEEEIFPTEDGVHLCAACLSEASEDE